MSLGGKSEIKPPDEFVGVVHRMGDRFSGFVNAVNPNRLLGNASTRCSYGFPAARGVSDRILVLSEGRLTACFLRSEATEHKIMEAATAGAA